MKKITTLLFAITCLAIAANATVTINVRTTTGEPPISMHGEMQEGSMAIGLAR